MKTLYKLILIAAAANCSAITVAAQTTSVLSVSDSSTIPTVIVPESFETDTKAMLEDWYLKNYTVLDTQADKRPQAEFSDDVILERLAALPTEIELPLNGPVRNMISFYANRKRQLVENMLGLSLYYMPIFEEALERHGMPNELRYLPVIESALVPTAVSKAGAAGLWQFMPPTATGLGLEINSLVDQRRDPYLSSDAAARYLKQLFNTYGDWSLAIAAYNCGPGNVNKALRRAGGGKHDFWEIYPFLPTETRGYVPAFIAANYIMNYHKEHNISPALAKRPIITDTVHVNKRVHFEQISQVLDIPMEEIRALNPQFRKDLIPGDIRPYSLVLPSLQTLAYIANEDSILNFNAKKYARRGIVEPATGAATGRDSRGEYYDEETVIYHTVARNETLTKIANKYGVTVASIRKNNKIGKTVKRGTKLKIKTVQRRYKPVAPAVDTTATTAAPDTTAAVNPIVPADSTSTVSAQPDSVSGTQQVSEAFTRTQPEAAPAAETVKPQPEVKKTETRATAPKPARKAATVTHTVKRGENLSKIAKRYGVTIAAIKRANNMAGEQIQAGQKLKIPQK
ncbi:MAG: transglycosylase SLT domain-containing protein [Muribaculaceae bacterium]|nr:transglycosylase SLT domain-containing protein [Muribaculaceae bacterium]